MKHISFNLTDSLNTPIMVTDSNGKVLYKNHFAKKVIKSPRLNASIEKHIDKNVQIAATASGTVKIVSTISNGNIFYRAFVVRILQSNHTYYIWLFGSPLQIPEPSEFDLYNLQKIENVICQNLHILNDLLFYSTKSSLDRYSKISTTFYEAMKYLNHFADDIEDFRVHKVLTSLKNKTEEIAELCHIRASIDLDEVSPNCFYHLPFKTFTVLYTQALLTMIKISSYKPVQVKFRQLDNIFKFELKAPIKPLKNIPENGSMLFEIAAAFPDEYFNIVFLEQIAQAKEYKIKYSVENEEGNLYLKLVFTADLSQKCPRVSENTDFISNLRFEMLEKRILEHLSFSIETFMN